MLGRGAEPAEQRQHRVQVPELLRHVRFRTLGLGPARGVRGALSAGGAGRHSVVEAAADRRRPAFTARDWRGAVSARLPPQASQQFFLEYLWFKTYATDLKKKGR